MSVLQIQTVTCSRVGHVFKNFAYKFEGDKESIIQKNLIRVAETWMDGLRKYFYASTRVYDIKRALLDADEVTSLVRRKQLRQRLGCRNFDWYMYNVIPEVEIPPTDAVFYGEIMNLESRACWDVANDDVVTVTYICFLHKIIPENHFVLTADGLLRYKDRCVRVQAPRPHLALDECPRSSDVDAFGVWRLVNGGVAWGHLVVRWTNPDGDVERWCVTQATNVLRRHEGEQMPQIEACNPDDNFQRWAFTYKFDFDQVPPPIHG